MTDKPTPTDAEIVALMRDGNNCNYNDEGEHIDFARAVLAKWGTPAPVGVGEVAERYRNAIASACEGWTMPDGLRKHLETALWSQPTPQPTQPQAGAVPLDEARRLFDAGWKAAALCSVTAKTLWQPESSDSVLASFEAAFSAAHGIKGGQHG